MHSNIKLLKERSTNKDCKILVVDDDESIRMLLTELLSDEGYVVTAVTRGEDAIIELGRQRYYLAMIDLVMPGIKGTQVLDEISRNFPKTDAIMITSNASLETSLEALRLGAQDYIIKPFSDLEMVVRVVNKTVEKRLLVEENNELHEKLVKKSQKLECAVQRLSSLNDMANALHSILDLKEILHLFIRLIADELEAERASLMLVHGDKGELTIEAAVGFEEGLTEKVRVPIGVGISGWVAQEGKTLLVEDIEKDERFQKRDESNYNSDSFISAPLILSVPIKRQHKVIGVINVNNKKGGGIFTEDDLQFVTTLAGQASIAIENARIFEKLRDVYRELKDTHFQTITALADALEAKDAVTGGHCDRMLRYAFEVAKHLGLTENEIEQLRYAAVLHDIGKIGIPEQILQKPDKLSPEEYEWMKKHPNIGAKMMQGIKFLSSVAPIILAHHEWYDGRGYPHGLSYEEIPIQSRIISALDAYDAMTTDRPYRKAPGKDWALQELQRGAGSQFDPRVVDVFLAVLENDEGEDCSCGNS